MSKKSPTPGPVPHANEPHFGLSPQAEAERNVGPQAPTGEEEDPKRRLGDFTGKGEHARQQSGPLNDGSK